MAPLKILIVGCSIAGPTLASFLLLSPATEKPQVTILERSPTVRKEGQNIDVRGSGATIIRKLGLAKAVKAASTREEGVQHVDSANRVWAQVAADKTGKIQTPTSDAEILRGHLADICWKSSQRVSKLVEADGGPGVTYIFGDYLSSIEQDSEKVHVKFANCGKSESFDLLVGADGLQSNTRRMVWGESSEHERVHRLGAYVGFFSMPRGKTNTLWRRWYHAPGARGVAVRPDCVNNKTTVFMSVMSKTDSRLLGVATHEYRSVDDQKQLLEEYFRNSGWECPRIIEQMWASTDFHYDMIAQVKMDSWSKGRVVLLGDAGYCASPFSGMGTTLALNGAYTLAGLLTRHADDLPTAFSEYERKMRPLVGNSQKLAPGMPRIMHPETVWGVWALNLFMAFLTWSKIGMILFLLKGPSASTSVSVEDYGFAEMPEMDV